MAYTQNPGRGSNTKTGHGIPSALLQEKNASTGGYKKPYEPMMEMPTGSGRRALMSNEAKAVSDSTAVSNKYKFARQNEAGNAVVAGSLGNAAAEKVRAGVFNAKGQKESVGMASGGKYKRTVSPARQTKNPKYKGSTEKGSMGMAAGGEANTDLLKVAKDYAGKAVKKAKEVLGYRDTSGDDSRYSDKVTKKKK
jgi:hypothetical protein